MMILGGIKRKYDRSGWIVLIGVLLLFLSFVLVTLFNRLGGIFLSFNSFPAVFLYPLLFGSNPAP